MGKDQRRALVGKPIHDDPKAPYRDQQSSRSVVAGKRPSAINTEAMTVTMDSDPLRADQIHKACKVVAVNLRDDPEAANEIMAMLGIHPHNPQETAPLLEPSNLPNPHHTTGDAIKRRRKITQK